MTGSTAATQLALQFFLELPQVGRRRLPLGVFQSQPPVGIEHLVGGRPRGEPDRTAERRARPGHAAQLDHGAGPQRLRSQRLAIVIRFICGVRGRFPLVHSLQLRGQQPQLQKRDR